MAKKQTKDDDKCVREYDARDLLGNQIFPGNLVAVSVTGQKKLRIGIVIRLSLRPKSHWGRNENRVTIITDSNKHVGANMGTHGYNSSCIKEVKASTLDFNQDGIVLIGNPIFNIDVTNVSFIMENLELIRERWFDDKWKPGDSYHV